ncbi:unnamed protein product [Symbiodinium microadriaticum]|nr:unnamed protein product [Symbiodinium microadriaticum]
MATLPAGDNVEARRRPLAPLWTDENIRHADSKGGALRPLQEEVAVRYKELVKREQALAAREQLASEVCQAQEEREQDLEALALRLQQQTEVIQEREVSLAKEKQVQDVTKASDVEVAGLRLSERAGRLATREKRIAEDEAELVKRERDLAAREAELQTRQDEVAEAESRNMHEFAARRRSVEQRELRAAELESRLAWLQDPRGCGGSSSRPCRDERPADRRPWPERTEPEKSEKAILQQRVMALFHQSPEEGATVEAAKQPRPSAAPEIVGMAGVQTPSVTCPGEELTMTVYADKPPQRYGVRQDLSKVVHFDELLSRQAPPPPPASWERTSGDLVGDVLAADACEAAGRGRLTARKQISNEATSEIKVLEGGCGTEGSSPWLARLRRLTRCR